MGERSEIASYEIRQLGASREAPRGGFDSLFFYEHHKGNNHPFWPPIKI